MSGLERWETCTPELARIIESLEINIDGKVTEDQNLPHHEDREAFQRNFATDVKKICNGMEINPFEENNFVNISNTSVFYDEEIKKIFKTHPQEGEAQFQMFLQERLIDRTKSVDAPARNNNYKLPRTANDAMTKKENKLIYLIELCNVAQSIAENEDSLYHSSKSDILKCFPIYNNDSIIEATINDYAMIIDLSLFTKSHHFNENTTFLEYANSLREIILNVSSSCVRCDIIVDQYFKDSLKQNIRSTRGQGSKKHFKDETKIPEDFRNNFLANNDNKNDLHVYLAEKLLESPPPEKNLVVTYNGSTLTNIEKIIHADEILCCNIEEADQRIIQHLINCAVNGFKKLFVITGDTDVLILLIAALPNILENFQCALVCQFGIGNNIRHYNINNLCSSLKSDVCKTLPFFHAFTGCDMTSSFYNHSKLKFFDAWMKYKDKDNIASVYSELFNEPNV